MNKKIFGIKISTILTALGCIAIAFVIWVIAKYNIDFPSDADLGAGAVLKLLRGLK